MVLEVLSPHPRISKIDERIGWFAEHGVRECWVLHRAERGVELRRCYRSSIEPSTRFSAGRGE